jgi:hypothetical protein
MILESIAGLSSILTSGAGGGIVGSLFGILKQSQERKERVAMAQINLDRDRAEYENAEKERHHALTMIDKQGEIKLETIQTESEAEIEISNQFTLSEAQEAEFKNLNTSTAMDNFRASIRPLLAVWAAILFTSMLGWAFLEYKDTIDDDVGGDLLLGMFATLTFIITSVISFYYVSRRNAAPK